MTHKSHTLDCLMPALKIPILPFLFPAAGFCDRENTVTSAGNYSWPMSAAEISVSLPCVFGAVDESSTRTATRECGPVGDWMEPNLSQCRSSFDIIETMNVSS